MRIAFLPPFRIAAGLLLAVLLVVVGDKVLLRRSSISPVALLARAVNMLRLNGWFAVEPLCRLAELHFIQRSPLSKALSARASEMPPGCEPSISFPVQITLPTHDPNFPEEREPEAGRRVLTILGMLEVNFDSAMARRIWAEAEAVAVSRHHYLLASGAVGNQAIAAFILGYIETAKKNLVRSWIAAKTADPAVPVRCASVGQPTSAITVPASL